MHTQQLTDHASRRMQHRGIGPDAVDAVLAYGRRVFTRGILVYAIGRKEVAECRELNIDLKGYEGVQVVCATNRASITVYRNRDFRGLRPGLEAAGAVQNRRLPWRPLANRFRVKMLSKVRRALWWWSAPRGVGAFAPVPVRGSRVARRQGWTAAANSAPAAACTASAASRRQRPGRMADHRPGRAPGASSLIRVIGGFCPSIVPPREVWAGATGQRPENRKPAEN